MKRNYILQGIHELGGEPRSDIGPVAQYLADIYELRPEVVRTEHLEFTITIDNQEITFESGAKRIDPEFAFALRRIKGWCAAADATELGLLLAGVTFNVTDQGRGRGGIFQDPIRMSSLASAGDGSPVIDMVWDSFYTFVAGADVLAQFTVPDLTLFPQGQVVRIGIAITGDVLRTRRLPGGAMVVSDGSGQQRG